MSHEDVLSLLGLIRKAGRLEMGEEPTGAACRARKAAVVLLAEDAAPNTCRRAAHFGELGKCLWLPLPCSKAELGRSLGRSSCAMLAVTDAGFAAALLKKLRALDPERYAAAGQALDEKAARVLQRQREQRAHEKNLQKKGRKPWAPPPPDPGGAPPAKKGRPKGDRAAKGPGPAKDGGRPRRTGRPDRSGPPASRGRTGPGRRGKRPPKP